MAIAIDATSTKIDSTDRDGYTYSWNHTVAGSDRLLVVCCCIGQDVCGIGVVTSMTYNSVAMTKIFNQNSYTEGIRIEMWCLIAPDTGTHAIDAVTSGAIYEAKFGAVSMTGANQSTQPESYATHYSSGSPCSYDITTVADGSMVVDVTWIYGVDGWTVGAGQTAFLDDKTGETSAGASYEGPKTPAGTVTMSWTTICAYDWVHGVAVFPPVTVASGQPATKRYGGVRFGNRMKGVW